ncbi:uncharacterized protein VTP21DRAFT_9916 [Calcarisporiella thermophila]|uniref:uncharacterized protein n=1 Tax=Calcarisporiella thermophila TaxID=911321 RepID=UPI00374324BE
MGQESPVQGFVRAQAASRLPQIAQTDLDSKPTLRLELRKARLCFRKYITQACMGPSSPLISTLDTPDNGGCHWVPSHTGALCARVVPAEHAPGRPFRLEWKWYTRIDEHWRQEGEATVLALPEVALQPRIILLRVVLDIQCGLASPVALLSSGTQHSHRQWFGLCSVNGGRATLWDLFLDQIAHPIPEAAIITNGPAAFLIFESPRSSAGAGSGRFKRTVHWKPNIHDPHLRTLSISEPCEPDTQPHPSHQSYEFCTIRLLAISDIDSSFGILHIHPRTGHLELETPHSAKPKLPPLYHSALVRSYARDICSICRLHDNELCFGTEGGLVVLMRGDREFGAAALWCTEVDSAPLEIFAANLAATGGKSSDELSCLIVRMKNQGTVVLNRADGIIMGVAGSYGEVLIGSFDEGWLDTAIVLPRQCPDGKIAFTPLELKVDSRVSRSALGDDRELVSESAGIVTVARELERRLHEDQSHIRQLADNLAQKRGILARSRGIVHRLNNTFWDIVNESSEGGSLRRPHERVGGMQLERRSRVVPLLPVKRKYETEAVVPKQEGEPIKVVGATCVRWWEESRAWIEVEIKNESSAISITHIRVQVTSISGNVSTRFSVLPQLKPGDFAKLYTAVNDVFAALSPDELYFSVCYGVGGQSLEVGEEEIDLDHTEVRPGIIREVAPSEFQGWSDQDVVDVLLPIKAEYYLITPKSTPSASCGLLVENLARHLGFAEKKSTHSGRRLFHAKDLSLLIELPPAVFNETAEMDPTTVRFRQRLIIRAVDERRLHVCLWKMQRSLPDHSKLRPVTSNLCESGTRALKNLILSLHDMSGEMSAQSGDEDGEKQTVRDGFGWDALRTVSLQGSFWEGGLR